VNDQPPSIHAHGSGVVGVHAVISGYAAAVIGQLIGRRWRAQIDGQLVGDDLREVESAMAALEQAGAGWRREQHGHPTFPPESRGSSGKGQGKPDAPGSGGWISSLEAGQLLGGISRQRVGQLVREGLLQGRMEGGRLLVPYRQVLSLRRRRSAG
jgi:hypothetical protein